MKAYKLVSDNLDVKNEEIVVGYFFDKDKAFQKAIDYTIEKESRDVIKDMSGNLPQYCGRSLEYRNSSKLPAVYHTSYYGPYRCALFIQEINIQ